MSECASACYGNSTCDAFVFCPVDQQAGCARAVPSVLLLSALHSQLRRTVVCWHTHWPNTSEHDCAAAPSKRANFSLGAIHPSLYSLSVSHPPALPCPAAAPCRATAAVTPQPWQLATAYCKATSIPSRRRSSNWTVRTLGGTWWCARMHGSFAMLVCARRPIACLEAVLGAPCALLSCATPTQLACCLPLPLRVRSFTSGNNQRYPESGA